MKKLCIMLSIALLTLNVNAQSDEKKLKSDMGILIFGGLNVASLSDGNETRNQPILGAHAGVEIKLADLSKNFGVKSELIFSQQGNKYSYGDGYYGGSTVSRLNYLNLPVLARYKTNSGFFAEAGLQPGLLLSAKEKRNSTSTNIKKKLNSFDLGVPIGLGYVYKKKVALSARFTPGLLNVNKSQGTYSAPKARNKVFSVRLSYAI